MITSENQSSLENLNRNFLSIRDRCNTVSTVAHAVSATSDIVSLIPGINVAGHAISTISSVTAHVAEVADVGGTVAWLGSDISTAVAGQPLVASESSEERLPKDRSCCFTTGQGAGVVKKHADRGSCIASGIAITATAVSVAIPPAAVVAAPIAVVAKISSVALTTTSVVATGVKLAATSAADRTSLVDPSKLSSGKKPKVDRESSFRIWSSSFES